MYEAEVLHAFSESLFLQRIFLYRKRTWEFSRGMENLLKKSGKLSAEYHRFLLAGCITWQSQSSPLQVMPTSSMGIHTRKPWKSMQMPTFPLCIHTRKRWTSMQMLTYPSGIQTRQLWRSMKMRTAPWGIHICIPWKSMQLRTFPLGIHTPWKSMHMSTSRSGIHTRKP